MKPEPFLTVQRAFAGHLYLLVDRLGVRAVARMLNIHRRDVRCWYAYNIKRSRKYLPQTPTVPELTVMLPLLATELSAWARAHANIEAM